MWYFEAKYYDIMCQCPERGDLHFYEREALVFYIVTNCVNALKGATFISTLILMFLLGSRLRSVNALKGATFISTDKPFQKSRMISCVNALKGATFISTLASGNPHK